jgi:hypothetical protein
MDLVDRFVNAILGVIDAPAGHLVAPVFGAPKRRKAGGAAAGIELPARHSRGR